MSSSICTRTAPSPPRRQTAIYSRRINTIFSHFPGKSGIRIRTTVCYFHTFEAISILRKMHLKRFYSLNNDFNVFNVLPWGRVLWFACLSVCLSVCPRAYLRNYTFIFTKCYLCRGSVFLWRRYDMLCTSGLMDGVMFAHNGQKQATRTGVCSK